MSEIEPGDRVWLHGTVTGINDSGIAAVEVPEHVAMPVTVMVPVGLLKPDPETVTA